MFSCRSSSNAEVREDVLGFIFKLSLPDAKFEASGFYCLFQDDGTVPVFGLYEVKVDKLYGA